jgi:hypothetical protein
MNASETVMIDALVRESFDGVVGDELGPFDYSVDDATRDNDQSAAADIITDELRRRLGRPLTLTEIIEVVEYVGVEWERRRERAKEAAWQRDQEKLLNADNQFWAPLGISYNDAELREAGRIK